MRPVKVNPNLQKLYKAARKAGWIEQEPPGRGARNKVVLISPDGQHSASFPARSGDLPKSYVQNIRAQMRQSGLNV